MSKNKVTFLPGRVEVHVDSGVTIMEAAIEAGVELEGPCGGQGTCGKCRVRLPENGSERWVLACRTAVTSDLVVEIPRSEVSLYRKSELSRTEINVIPEPGVRKILCQTRPPSLENQVADAERLLAALGDDNLVLQLAALRVLPTAIRAKNGLVTAVLAGDRVLAVEAGDTSRRLFGLAVDIGTNGEIVLAVQGRLMTCSTAAGPAFEGAQIRHGMRAAAGAIEGMTVDHDVHLKVIGDVPARGICGSGLMDAVAGLVRAGVIESGGRMISRDEAGHLPGALQRRLESEAGGNCFVLASWEETGAEPVLLTQKDVRELQLAKAAIRAGIEILLDQAGLTAGDIDRVLLAGAFGSYINKHSALSLGLLPPVSPERIYPVGNAAGAGARLALLSAEIRQKAAALARRVEHVELSARPGFQDRFIDALSF
ncbi:ASKHA domain-containing protein [Desulfotomaculum copahuensis]|uniref:2Fe-2S ferredoxin-type domain-containing protein n=1 Tax=Desulfotomaculum copahuensis TaxID=1838280 RepID=A0A1B7LJD1_9FIRM|nr:ASKHA domain-containing protein [Desulfotomaculum copahuensis]OAT86678.1 hypothetical protein A6M21_02315 [Desulfotomaculum copahuensis]